MKTQNDRIKDINKRIAVLKRYDIMSDKVAEAVGPKYVGLGKVQRGGSKKPVPLPKFKSWEEAEKYFLEQRAIYDKPSENEIRWAKEASEKERARFEALRDEYLVLQTQRIKRDQMFPFFKNIHKAIDKKADGDRYKEFEGAGRGKRTEKHQDGEGRISDFIDNGKKIAKKIIFGIDDYSLRTQSTLRKYGDYTLKSLRIGKYPIGSQGMLENILKAKNILNKGDWDKSGSQILNELGYDKLMHLYSIVELEGASHEIIVEKQTQITVEPNYGPAEKSIITAERNHTLDEMNIPLNGKKITLNELVENTRKKMGDEAFFSYNSQQQNCQHFLSQMLVANGLSSPGAKSFIFQDLKALYSQLPWVVSLISDLGTEFEARVITTAQQGGLKEKKKVMSGNPWVAHVKAFAVKNNMKYGDAMKSPACKSSYKKVAPAKKGKGIVDDLVRPVKFLDEFAKAEMAHAKKHNVNKKGTLPNAGEFFQNLAQNTVVAPGLLVKAYEKSGKKGKGLKGGSVRPISQATIDALSKRLPSNPQYEELKRREAVAQAERIANRKKLLHGDGLIEDVIASGRKHYNKAINRKNRDGVSDFVEGFQIPFKVAKDTRIISRSAKPVGVVLDAFGQKELGNVARATGKVAGQLGMGVKKIENKHHLPLV